EADPPPSSRGRPARASTIPSQGGDYLPAGLAVHVVPVLLPLATDEEPVHAGSAEQIVGVVVVVDRRRGEAVGAVQAAGRTALEVLDAGVVIGVGAAPYCHDREQRRDVGVVVGVAADQDGAAAAGAERVGAEAADEQVAAAAAVEPFVARPADQHVVGGT